MLVAPYHPVIHADQPVPLAPRPYPDGTAPVFRACASAMQVPTLTNVRIRSTRDANQIFYAVARNLLPMTVRRLDAEERRAITSGNVYVWEERGSSTEATGLGIERWTDGMRWSPSRVRDEFLFYHQKESDPEEASDLPPRWARVVRPKASSSDGSLSDASPENLPPAQRASDPERLIKQTYSVIVALPDDKLLRKWHLTAYFTQATVDSLKTVDEVLPGSRVVVPEGLFRSARTGKMRRDTTREKQYAFAKSLGVDVPPSIPETTMAPPYPGLHHAAPPHAPYGERMHDDEGMNVDPDLVQRAPPSGRPYNMPPAARPPQSMPMPPPDYGRPQNIPTTHERLSAQDWPAQGLTSPPIVPVSYQTSPSRMASPLTRPTSHAHPYAYAYATHMQRGGSPRMGPAMAPTTFYQYTRTRPPPMYGSAPGPSARYMPPRVAYAPGMPLRGPEPTRVAGASSSAGAYQRHWASAVPEDVPRAEQWKQASPVPAETKDMNMEAKDIVDADAIPAPPGDITPRAGTPRGSPPVQPVDLPHLLPPVEAVAGATRSRPSTPTPTPMLQPQPQSGAPSPLGLTRALIPLDDLGTAAFPRRDPADDALLRRFRGLRTTPPHQPVSGEL